MMKVLTTPSVLGPAFRKYLAARDWIDGACVAEAHMTEERKAVMLLVYFGFGREQREREREGSRVSL